MMGIRTLTLLLLCTFSLFARERIVSLSPSITEILYALDAGDTLVATSTYSLYPKEAQKLPIIGGYTNPNIEKIIAHNPTLVLGQSFNLATLEKLHYFHIKTRMLHLNTLKNIQDSIVLLGERLSKRGKAHELTQKIKNTITHITKTEVSHTVMIVYGLYEDLRSGIYIAGKNIFFDEIITLSGNTNAYTQTTTRQPVLSYENVIALNPEQIIILHSHATQSSVNVKKALKNWYKLPTKAAKNGKITIVDEDYLHIPSQRVAQTIVCLIKEMHD